MRAYRPGSRIWMLRAFSLQLVAALLAVSTVRAESDVEFILDLSGSMRQKLGGETQIESARKSLLKALDEISPKQLVALRVYGHRAEQTNKAESCKDTELLIPFKQLDKNEVAQKIANLVPKGYTPIAYSLQESRNDLLDVGVGRESERVIILMTDGEETCDGDPVAVLRKLKEEGFHLTVYTVGFNVNDVARKQLQDIAAFTGGRYFDAKDAVALEGALRDAAKESAAVIEKKKAVYGSEIRGGDSYETAVPIEPSKEYRLDHHQKINEYDYFSFDVKRGDDVTVTLSTREKGIAFRQNGQSEETTNPYAGLQLHNMKRERLKKIDIIGTAAKVESQHYRAVADEKLVLLLGSTYESMNKDHVLFTVTIERKGDADTPTDAGENMETALPVEAKRYAKSSIGDTDTMDVFSLQAKKGESYVIGVVPNNKDTGGFNMRVYDDFKQELFSRFSGSNNGIKSTPIEIKEDGTYFIELQYQDERPMDYSLVIKRQQALEGGGDSSGGQQPQ
ncbi:MAG: VWA domain-containing protein [Bdellovibrionota bacterium]